MNAGFRLVMQKVILFVIYDTVGNATHITVDILWRDFGGGYKLCWFVILFRMENQSRVPALKATRWLKLEMSHLS